MENYMFETEAEKRTIELFGELGYETEYAPNISPNGSMPQRESYYEVVLTKRLTEALKRINPEVSDDGIKETVRQIKTEQNVGLLENNHDFHKMLTDGVKIAEKDENGEITYIPVRLFDFDDVDNNDWLAVNQFTVAYGNKEKRPDIVVFVNGLPLVVIQFAKNEDNADLHDAFQHIQSYKNTVSSLLTYNSFMMISDGTVTKAGTLTSNEERFIAWKRIDSKDTSYQQMPQPEVAIRGMFDKKRFLDIIRHFVFFQSTDTGYIKILAAYHQYYAVNKAVARSLMSTLDESARRLGIIWHTQGSGKSISMALYTARLMVQKELQNPTVVVITDRNDLDNQLYHTFIRNQELLRAVPQQARSRKELKSLLAGRESGGIIFSTIQKFLPDDTLDEAFTLLTDRQNVIVIADEAHRSQYGFRAELRKYGNAAAVKYGYAKYIRDAFPNASFIGFTGTPIELGDKSTKDVFGDYIDIYNMAQSIQDGTTVKIYYESRIANLNNVNQELKPLIEESYEQITDEEELDGKELLKSKWAGLEAIVGAESRLKMVASDIVHHYEARRDVQTYDGGKAMIVVMSRAIAIDLYKQITAIRPEWHSDRLNEGKIKVVITGSAGDPPEWKEFTVGKAGHSVIAKRMKDIKDELELVIVCDMWLTGFDVPNMHTMYIDKPLHGHNLMQAIARVNRVYLDKKGGLIVDYIGIADNLQKALLQYSSDDRNLTGIDAEVAADIMIEKLKIAVSVLSGYNYSAFYKGTPEQRATCMVGAIDYILGLSMEKTETYIAAVTDAQSAFALCSTTERGKQCNVEMSFHAAVKSEVYKILMGHRTARIKNERYVNEHLKALVSQTVLSDTLIDTFGLAGMSEPNMSILSDEFMTTVMNLKEKNILAMRLQMLMRNQIRLLARTNLTQSKRFSEMLENSVRNYQRRSITTIQIIGQLIALAKQMKKAEEDGKATGLNKYELAFYDALADNNSAKDILGDEVLMQIARELTAKVKRNLKLDWINNQKVQSEMRVTIKKLLKKYDYPPDKTPEATKLIMEQTKLMCENELRDDLK